MNKNSYSEIFELILKKLVSFHKDMLCLGIDGGQGSGKSTILSDLENYLMDNSDYTIVYLETDDFLIDRDKRTNLDENFFKNVDNLNYLFDFKTMAKMIKTFQTTKNTKIKVDNLYNTLTGKKDRTKEYTFLEKNIILIGGPYILQENYPAFDLKIFIYVKRQNRLQNTLVRTLTKQRSVESQKILFNNFENFYKPYFFGKLSEFDLIIDNNDFSNKKIIGYKEAVD